MTKAVDNNRPNVGDTITFTVTLTNAGPDDATNVQVTDLLPAGLTFVSAARRPGDLHSGHRPVGRRHAGERRHDHAHHPGHGGQPRPTEQHGDGARRRPVRPEHGNNTASATETPQQADLVVFKRVSNPTPNVGDTITFTVRVTNAGPDNATGVIVQDLLPAGLTFLSAVPTQGNYNPVTGVWTVGTVWSKGRRR